MFVTVHHQINLIVTVRVSEAFFLEATILASSTENNRTIENNGEHTANITKLLNFSRLKLQLHATSNAKSSQVA